MHDSRPLEDPSEIRHSQGRRRNRSLRWVLLFIALLMVGMALVDHFLAPPGESRSIISLSMGGAALLSYLALRNGRHRWEGPLLLLSLLVFSGWAVYSYGSVRSASSLALLGAVVMAGTYLSLRSLIVATGGSLLILGALTWAEAGGQLAKPGLAADLRFWLMGSVIILVVGALLHHTRRATDEAYLRQLNQLEDRMRLEQERDQSQRRFRRIFQLNPTGLMIQFAGTQAILEVNPAFERSIGYPGDQLTGRSARVLWADEQRWREHSENLFEKGRTDWQRCRWLRADGEAIEVMLCSELSEDQNGMLILTTVTGCSGGDPSWTV